MACITEASSGFPNANGHIPGECALLPEVLGERGWNTYMVGKWHLCPEDEMNLASIKRHWPLGRGFERFYGFLGAETNQWYPDLVYDNHPVEQPKLPEEGYHFSVDITDKAISFIRDAKAVAPDKPFFLYYCAGRRARAAPRAEGVGRQVQGPFDMGYEAYREVVFASAEAARIVPEHAELSPINPYADLERAGGPAVAGARRRAAVGVAEATRRSGSSAGWPRSTPASSATPTTRSAGCSTTSSSPDSSRTRSIVLVSDNGASGEGGPNGR